MSRVVAVVGTVNHDVIVRSAGVSESLGGILYNVVVLAALLEGTEFVVRPLARLGEEHLRDARRLLRAFPDVDTSGLIADPAGTNRSRLDYSGPGDRVEHVELRVPALSGSDLAGAEGAAAVLVNMISGRDVERPALAALRAGSDGLFLLDVQALARTLETPRRPRSVPDWEQWCSLFDVIRGNEEEIAHFAGAGADVEQAPGRILGAGCAEVLVTRGERGSRRVARTPSGPLGEDLPAFPTEAGPVDPTGCGDAYLSGVCAARLLGAAPEDAPWLGAWVAAEVVTLSGLEALAALRGCRARAARAVDRLRGLP